MTSRIFTIILLATLISAAGGALARDAAFLDPNSGVGDEAVKVDPKPDVDIGDTQLNIAKRVSVFFVNQTNLPIKIEKVVLNNDSNVTAEASSDDCMKQGTIAPLSRCSVEVSVTPTSPGSWSVDMQMTHNGAGRITRARITGKTSGNGSGDNKNTGLSVNTKDIKPVDFGDVVVGEGKTVRSTLMINDSPEPITIYSIDVIEADNGLQRLEQGCAVDMELPPGASCPVTLLWTPQSSGPVSTDLIIRHSGKLGFAVIPIRGLAKAGSTTNAAGTKSGDNIAGKHDSVPLPPTPQDIEKEAATHIPPVAEAVIAPPPPANTGDGAIHLIGTVGDRALILKPGGETAVVSIGTEFDIGSKQAKLLAINARTADFMIDGVKKTLNLEAAASLVAKANEGQQDMTDSSTIIQGHGGYRR